MSHLHCSSYVLKICHSCDSLFAFKHSKATCPCCFEAVLSITEQKQMHMCIQEFSKSFFTAYKGIEN